MSAATNSADAVLCDAIKRARAHGLTGMDVLNFVIGFIRNEVPEASLALNLVAAEIRKEQYEGGAA